MSELDHPGAAILVEDLHRSFDERRALEGVSLRVNRGQVHALLGPNGAGKTTLLRVLVGSVRPDGGRVEVMGRDWEALTRPSSRHLFGLVSAADRSSYHRLSGLENLVFFARLHGLDRRRAVERVKEVMGVVGLSEATSVRTGVYSHGMQKRLAIGRALLTRPPVLLVDEATHDLDPAGARRVRELLRELADEGAAVLWATQRVEEIRGIVDGVTVLDRGAVRYSGTVEGLIKVAQAHRYAIELEPDPAALARAQAGLGELASLEPSREQGWALLEMKAGRQLGEAFQVLLQSGCRVVSCREERSEIEEAFLHLTGDRP